MSQNTSRITTWQGNIFYFIMDILPIHVNIQPRLWKVLTPHKVNSSILLIYHKWFPGLVLQLPKSNISSQVFLLLLYVVGWNPTAEQFALISSFIGIHWCHQGWPYLVEHSQPFGFISPDNVAKRFDKSP